MPNTFAKEIKCRVLDVVWMTPSVVRVRFAPSREFHYEPGQFLSVVVPSFRKGGQALKRCYSFASGPEEARKYGYELCVKYVPGGIGSGFLGSLSPGDTFYAQAPYGHFTYRHPGEDRSVCFISTGTGIAPFRSAVFSEAFQNNPPQHTLCLQGIATSEEILYRGAFESLGIETVYALSRPEAGWTGFKGRVTDYLKQMPRDYQWHATDFYLCGNGQMIQQVSGILQNSFGVKAASIHKENFAAPAMKPAPVNAPAAETAGNKRKWFPFRLPIFPEAA